MGILILKLIMHLGYTITVKVAIIVSNPYLFLSLTYYFLMHPFLYLPLLNIIMQNNQPGRESGKD